MNDGLKTDGDIISRILSGESSLFGVLIGKYERLVFSFLLPQVCNLQDVEDLAQETFIRAYRYLAGFDVSRKFSNWVVAIARNLLSDKFQKNAHDAAAREVYKEMFDKNGPFPAFENPEIRIEMHEAFRKTFLNIMNLPEELKVPMLLRIVEEMPYGEISEVLNIPLQTVKSRIFTARRLLRAKRDSENVL
ncbi:hypothetical protein AUK22_08080 [bacterium CG2_30_54_10]|nr:MAG: hypothetical protein AUK22_08080 [bacterium CG2_30_54_10]